MSIEHREGLVEDYFAGVLQGSEREAFERHLEGCAICRQRLAEVKALDSRLRILIAEDNADLLDILSLIIEGMGHVALCARDGLEALRLAEERDPDVGLLDIDLPGIDGVELTRRLKSTPHLREIPLVAMTGGIRGEEAVKAGCCALLEKPFTSRQLKAAIGGILSKGGV